MRWAEAGAKTASAASAASAPPAARGAPIRPRRPALDEAHRVVSGSVLVALGDDRASCAAAPLLLRARAAQAGHAPLRAAPDDDDDDYATVLDESDDSTVTPPKAPRPRRRRFDRGALRGAGGELGGRDVSCVVFVPRADLAQQRDGEALRRKLLVMGASHDGALGGPRSIVEYIDANGDRLQLTSRTSVHAVARSASAIRVGEVAPVPRRRLDDHIRRRRRRGRRSSNSRRR